MAKLTKLVTMTVTVRVPKDMPVADARREVRTLINEQCNYSADAGAVLVSSISPA